MYQKLKEATEYISSRNSNIPKVGLILGSGLGKFIDSVKNPTIISYSDIPHFHTTSVEGHDGRLVLGEVEGVSVAVLQGRLHAYEGHAMEDIVFPVRVLATLGIESLILTNAAGGVNEKYRPGNLVLIEDHINLMGNNPLIGPNISELGPRFPDMTHAYDPELRSLLQATAKELGSSLHSGVYCSVLGPTYETPAEIRMIRTLGGDMVGMSTVPEAIAANHLGLKVAGISCITNMAAGMVNQKLSHDDVKAQALKVLEEFSGLLTASIKKM